MDLNVEIEDPHELGFMCILKIGHSNLYICFKNKLNKNKIYIKKY